MTWLLPLYVMTEPRIGALLAQTDGGGQDVIQPFLNVGIAGAVLLLMVFGYIVPRSTLNAALEREKATQAKLDKQTDFLNERVIPALSDNLAAQRQAAEERRAYATDRETMMNLVREMKGEVDASRRARSPRDGGG